MTLASLSQVPKAADSAPDHRKHDPGLSEALRLVSRIGVLTARAGAAAFRVRECMRRTALAFGAAEAEVVVTPEAICASVADDFGSETLVTRIVPGGVNMNALCRIEMLTREIAAEPHRYSTTRVIRALDAIELAPPLYPPWVTVLSLGAACAAFCGVIHGSPWQMAAAFVGACSGQTLRLYAHARQAPTVAVVTLSAFASCCFSELALLVEGRLAASLGVADLGPDLARLASVLYLIPGVGLVTSWIDIIHFDLSAGLARAAHASLILGCIAAGLLMFLQLNAWLAP